MESIRETKRPRTVTLTVPDNDYSLLRTITKRMGWTINPQPRKRKAEEHIPNATTIRAIMDVEAGKVHYAKDLDDLFAQLEI